MDESVYIIKPEAMRHRGKIHSLIRKAGLCVVAKKIVALSEGEIDSLYPGIERNLRAATLYYFADKPCEIGIVEGTDAIRRLQKLAGTSVNPAECASSTIRGQFGVREPARFLSAVYYLNGFHRSLNPSEVRNDLALFHSLNGLHEVKRQ